MLIDKIGELPSTLTRLSLVNIAGLSARDIVHGIHACIGLRFLDLSMSGINDTGLVGILKEARVLRELVIKDVEGVKDLDSVVGSFASKELRVLEKSWSDRFQRGFFGRPELMVLTAE
jgi:hypothetical protein